MDLSLSQMLQMQKELFSLHKDSWPPMAPEAGRDYILFMVEEIGEVIAVLKKKGNQAVVDDPGVRERFLEEMADILMYYNDVLLRFRVTPEELSSAYARKHAQNMKRNFSEEYREKYTDG